MARKPDLDRLELFLDVAATGSISKAAQRHGISQPAASKSLTQLETAFGLRLLERTPTGSAVSVEGRAVVDWAARVIAEVEHLMEAVRALRSPKAADLSIAASLTIAEHLVPNWLSQLRKRAPDMHVSLTVRNSHDVQAMLHHHQTDLGLVETLALDPRLESKVIAHDTLTVVVSPNHPWVKRKRPVRASTLARAHLIVREPGSGTRETLDRALAQYSPKPPLLELGSNAAVRGAVQAGVGAAVLSQLAVQDAVAKGDLVTVPVDDLELSRPLTAMWQGPLTPAARTFLTCAQPRA